MAQWTDTIFSLGAVRSEGAEDELNHPASGQTANGVDGDAEYETLQAALDAYGITEVSEPTWMPEGYALYNINVSCPSDGRLLFLSAHYTDGTSYLLIDIESYQDEPYAQIEKTDDPVETFEVNGLLVYLLENTNNNAAAWATEHYEYCVSGAVDKSVLRQIVLSAYGESGFDENG